MEDVIMQVVDSQPPETTASAMQSESSNAQNQIAAAAESEAGLPSEIQHHNDQEPTAMRDNNDDVGDDDYCIANLWQATQSSYAPTELCEVGNRDRDVDSTHRKKLIALPTEILENIAAFLSLADRKSLRITCHSLAAVANRKILPLLQHISAIETLESLQALVEISKNKDVASMVKHLTYSSATFVRETRWNWKKLMKQEMRNRNNSPDWVNSTESLPKYELYRQLMDGRTELASKRLDVDLLATAMESLQLESITADSLISYCPLPNLHNVLIWDSCWPGFSEHMKDSCKSRNFIAILRAISRSCSRVKSLKAETGLFFLTSSPDSHILGEMKLGISRLVKLDLTVVLAPADWVDGAHTFDRKFKGGSEHCNSSNNACDTDELDGATNWRRRPYVMAGALGRFLQAAKQIEILSLSFVHNSQEHLCLGHDLQVLGQRKMGPRLHTLKLSNAICDASQLLAYLRENGAPLRSLVLHRIWLHESREWETLFTGLRKLVQSGELNLKTLEFTGVFGIFEFVPLEELGRVALRKKTKTMDEGLGKKMTAYVLLGEEYPWDNYKYEGNGIPRAAGGIIEPVYLIDYGQIGSEDECKGCTREAAGCTCLLETASFKNGRRVFNGFYDDI